LNPKRYERHGPRIAGDNKNCVVFPEKIGGEYVILHRPMPRIECVRVSSLRSEWPLKGVTILGPRPGTWRSSRVGAGAPPIRTRIGWLLAFHGATSIEEGNVYSMGWCVLDIEQPEKVLYVSNTPPLSPEAPYEIEMGIIPQLDHANFIHGVQVVFAQGLVEVGDDLIVYYGAADVTVAAARVNKAALVDSLEKAIAMGEGGIPL
jgi:Predicted glycosylase